MLPKEKAKHLFQKMLKTGDATQDFVYDATAKASAILAVEELINMANLYDIHNAKEPAHIYTFNVVLYWQEVKVELGRL
jgi:hypothetical protein